MTTDGRRGEWGLGRKNVPCECSGDDQIVIDSRGEENNNDDDDDDGDAVKEKKSRPKLVNRIFLVSSLCVFVFLFLVRFLPLSLLD